MELSGTVSWRESDLVVEPTTNLPVNIGLDLNADCDTISGQFEGGGYSTEAIYSGYDQDDDSEDVSDMNQVGRHQMSKTACRAWICSHLTLWRPVLTAELSFI